MTPSQDEPILRLERRPIPPKPTLGEPTYQVEGGQTGWVFHLTLAAIITAVGIFFIQQS